MKIRQSFVTNSSSSSFLLVYQVDCDSETIKEEFGKWGTELIDNYAVRTKEELISSCYEFEENEDICFECDPNNECKESISECSKYKDAMIDYINEHYFKFKEGSIYLVGYRNQGYGGDCDVTDDDAVKLGDMLKIIGKAKVVYQGEWS